MASLGAEFLTLDALRALGFGGLGASVLIHPSVVIVGLENLVIGDLSRIDAHTVIVANAPVVIGRNVHIGSGCYIAGAGTVTLDDFSGLSQGVRIYSATDDYSGAAMTNPTVPEAFTAVERAPVRLGRHVIIGSGSVVLPGVTVGEGSAVGALSLVNRSLDPWGLYAGVPAKRVRDRRRDLLALEAAYLSGQAPSSR